MANVEIMNLNVVCRCFPEIPIPEIPRDHLLDTVEKIFEGETQVLVVEGVEGIGKTTLLAQFARRHSNNALSLFIRPTSRLAYAPEYLKLILSEQLHWALCSEVLDTDNVDESYWRTQWPKLQKRAQKSKATYYFIVDGLQDIPKEEARIQDTLLKDILPLGLSGFRFLLSGDIKQFSEVLHRSILCKSFPLATFSLDESERYLADLKLDRQSLEDVYKMCGRGIPSHLASVRRMIQSGIDIHSILDEEPDNLPDFIAMEWRNIRTATSDQKKMLAVIAYGRRRYTTDDLARIFSLVYSEVEDFIRNSGIIAVDPQKKELSYISEPHRRYAAKQLSEYREEIINLLIDDLLKDKDSDVAISYLPCYYEQAGRLDELLNYLTPEHFTKVLANSQSLNPVRSRAELGLLTARKLNRNEDLMRFAMQKSVITELDMAEVSRAEIEAIMSLKDHEAAFALAQNSVLKEDRLHLLSIVAKMKREQGLILEQELMEQIALLYEQIDAKTLGDRAIDIASDLIYSNPDLAIKLVESAAEGHEDDELDWTFMKLSIAPLLTSEDQSQFSDAVEKTLSRIKDPKIQEFSAATSVLFGQYSASQVIDRVNNFEPENRLFFLRQWTSSNRNREDAANVIDYALDLLIKDTPYTPKTRDLREIAMALPSVADMSRAKQLVGRFDSQKGAIEKLGTTKDYTRLQLLLAQTESKFDFTAAHNRLMETYWYISDLKDLFIKTECMAWMVASLVQSDPKGILESQEGLHTVTRDELRTYVKQLLLTTADHFFAVRGTIRALAKTNSEIVFEIANALNTQERRDLAILEIVENTIDRSVSEFDMDFLGSALKKISDSELRDKALLIIIRSLSKTNELLALPLVEKALPLIESIKDIRDAVSRCKTASFAYSFLFKQDADRYSGLINSLLHTLDSAWKSIDVGWLKVNTGFKISRALALSSPETARKYLELTDEIREDVIIDGETPALTYLYCLKLAIRAYSGLLPNAINTSEDLERLRILIDHLPSNGERAILWSELVLRCYIAKQFDLCQSIVGEHIKPLTNNIPKGDSVYRQQVFTTIMPALFVAHRATAIDAIAKLPQPYRDDACDSICDFLFRKQPPSEPYHASEGDGYLLSFEEVLDICEMLKLMETDRMIYSIIAKISESLVSSRNRDKFSKQQKYDIADRLEKIVADKLPDHQNIQHDGYKIVALAQLARIRRGEHKVWENLVQAARNIPNTADQALVLSTIASTLPSKDTSWRNEVVEEAKTLIETIPSDLDRIDRYIELAKLMVGLDSSMSRTCLKAAMTFSLVSDDAEGVYLSQKRIIDLAHRIDHHYAATLTSLIDDDPARAKTKKGLISHLQLLDTKKQMVDQTSPRTATIISKADYPKAAWMNLGALNANRIEPIHFDFVRQYVEASAELPIQESYPIFAWIIENSIKRVGKTDQARTFLIPMFEATLLASELSGRIAARSLVRLKEIKKHAFISASDSCIIIDAGEREKALRFIREWLSRETSGYLKICDPFFGIDDLEVLQMLRFTNATCKVFILTSKKQQDGLPQPLDETFRTHWRLRISDQDPPDTEIAVVGTETGGELPIHDRWWLTKGSGLRFGTSFNSLGITKTSEISLLTPEEAELHEKEVNQYLFRERREYNKEKLRYNWFTL